MKIQRSGLDLERVAVSRLTWPRANLTRSPNAGDELRRRCETNAQDLEGSASAERDVFVSICLAYGSNGF